MSIVTVVIETPRNTAGKYIFDPVNQCYKLKKILPLGMYFPYDFGMIGNTIAEDGDPADAMVITECIAYPGVRLQCRMIGAMQAKQTKDGALVRNDRYFLIPLDSVVFEHIKELNEFSRRHNQQLKDFFVNYTNAENKKIREIKFINAASATKSLERVTK